MYKLSSEPFINIDELNDSRKRNLRFRFLTFVFLMVMISGYFFLFERYFLSIFALGTFLAFEWMLICSNSFLTQIEKDLEVLEYNIELTNGNFHALKLKGVVQVLKNHETSMFRIKSDDTNLNNYIKDIIYKQIPNDKEDLRIILYYGCTNDIQLYILFSTLFYRFRLTKGIELSLDKTFSSSITSLKTDYSPLRKLVTNKKIFNKLHWDRLYSKKYWLSKEQINELDELKERLDDLSIQA